MNNLSVFIARLVRAQVRLVRSIELPSVVSGFLRSCRNDGGRVASVRGRSCS